MATTNSANTVRRHLRAVAKTARPDEVPDLLGLFAGVLEESTLDQERKRLIGRRMKLLRERSPHTQESLADLLGLSVRGYQKAEETGSIRHARLEKLAEIHRVDVDYFYEQNNPQPLAQVEAELSVLQDAVTELRAAVATLVADSARQTQALQALLDRDRPAEHPGEGD